uniref:Uncharacterized protein n=1 Tax=Arundo donax TaxID=35708 RepID=A0A0A9HN61_ARUDO
MAADVPTANIRVRRYSLVILPKNIHLGIKLYIIM